MGRLEIESHARWAVAATAAIAAAAGGVWVAASQPANPPVWHAGAVEVSRGMGWLLLLGAAGLALLSVAGDDGWRRVAGRGAQAVSALVLLLSALSLGQQLVEHAFGFDRSWLLLAAGSRVRPPSALSLTLLAAGLLALARGHARGALYPSLAACAINVVAVVGLVFNVDEVYANPELAESAWPPLIGLLALGVGLVIAYNGATPDALLRRRDVGGSLARRLLPAAVLIPIVVGLLSVEGEKRQLYDTAMGNGLLVFACVLLQAAFIWMAMTRLSRAATQAERDAQALRRADQERARILETTNECFVALDRQFRYLYVNAAAGRWLRQPPGQLLGRGMWEVLADEVGSAFYDACQRAMNDRVPQHLESFSVPNARWYDSHVYPSDEGLSVFWHDVTERKGVEQALREADRRKTQFLAVLSHELRNPLAPIANSLYILDHAAPGSERAERAREVIGRQVEHLKRLVNDLLDVTRIARNKIELHRERVELSELVRRTVDDYRSVFEQNGVRLEFTPAQALAHVDADPGRLSQVVGNLLHNAAKFARPGGGTRVSVSIEQDCGRAAIRVADDGIGLEPEVIGRLFQPYVQAETAPAPGKGGLGLGLSLVKGLVELHGGEVSAASAGPGRGAEFVVRLPLERGRA